MESQVKAKPIFQAKTQAKILPIESPPRGHVRITHEMTFVEYELKYEFNQGSSTNKPEKSYETRSTRVVGNRNRFLAEVPKPK